MGLRYHDLMGNWSPYLAKARVVTGKPGRIPVLLNLPSHTLAIKNIPLHKKQETCVHLVCFHSLSSHSSAGKWVKDGFPWRPSFLLDLSLQGGNHEFTEKFPCKIIPRLIFLRKHLSLTIWDGRNPLNFTPFGESGVRLQTQPLWVLELKAKVRDLPIIFSRSKFLRLIFFWKKVSDYPHLKLTAQAPENWWLEYFPFGFRPIFRSNNC